jgi:hypothetical protein
MNTPNKTSGHDAKKDAPKVPDHNRYNILISSYGQFLATVTLIITFGFNACGDRKAREEQFRQSLYSKQLEYYSETLHAVGQVNQFLDHAREVRMQDPVADPAYQTAKADFFKLYYGRMNLIESSLVDTMMRGFAVHLAALEEADPSTMTDYIDSVQKQGFRLAAGCRRSLATTFDVRLDTVIVKPRY